MFALDDDLCVLRVDEIIGKWMKMELIGKDGENHSLLNWSL
jgi:hypothetical protein